MGSGPNLEESTFWQPDCFSKDKSSNTPKIRGKLHFPEFEVILEGQGCGGRIWNRKNLLFSKTQKPNNFFECKSSVRPSLKRFRSSDFVASTQSFIKSKSLLGNLHCVPRPSKEIRIEMKKFRFKHPPTTFRRSDARLVGEREIFKNQIKPAKSLSKSTSKKVCARTKVRLETPSDLVWRPS